MRTLTTTAALLQRSNNAVISAFCSGVNLAVLSVRNLRHCFSPGMPPSSSWRFNFRCNESPGRARKMSTCSSTNRRRSDNRAASSGCCALSVCVEPTAADAAGTDIASVDSSVRARFSTGSSNTLMECALAAAATLSSCRSLLIFLSSSCRSVLIFLRACPLFPFASSSCCSLLILMSSSCCSLLILMSSSCCSILIILRASRICCFSVGLTLPRNSANFCTTAARASSTSSMPRPASLHTWPSASASSRVCLSGPSSRVVPWHARINQTEVP